MYELLGLVKDGKAPKKIIYNGYIWEYKEETYYSNNICIYDWCNMMNVLNDTVEILEEENKIPEKIEIINEKNCNNNWKWKVKGEEHYYNISTPQKIIADKINQVIDYLNSKGE